MSFSRIFATFLAAAGGYALAALVLLFAVGLPGLFELMTASALGVFSAMLISTRVHRTTTYESATAVALFATAMVLLFLYAWPPAGLSFVWLLALPIGLGGGLGVMLGRSWKPKELPSALTLVILTVFLVSGGLLTSVALGAALGSGSAGLNLLFLTAGPLVGGYYSGRSGASGSGVFAGSLLAAAPWFVMSSQMNVIPALSGGAFIVGLGLFIMGIIGGAFGQRSDRERWLAQARREA